MIVELWDQWMLSLFGVFRFGFTVFLAWMGYMMFKDLRKAWKNEKRLKGEVQ